MPISTLLAPERVIVAPDCADKWALIELLAAMASTGGDAVAIAVAAEAREREMTTGLGEGVAVPHAILEGAVPSGTLAVLPAGMEFESFDGAPVHLVLFLLVPDSIEGRQEHVRVLGEAVRCLTDPRGRTDLMGCTDVATVLKTLRGIEERLLA